MRFTLPFLTTLLTALLLGSFSPAHADLVAHFRFDDDLKDVTSQEGHFQITLS
jgi:hypothetical protein